MNELSSTTTTLPTNVDAYIQTALTTEALYQISRQTYDGVLQHLCGAKLRVGHWHTLLQAGDVTPLQQEFDALEQSLTQDANDLRLLLRKLQTIAPRQTFVTKIADALTQAENEFGVTGYMVLKADCEKVAPQLKEDVFQLIRDAMVAQCALPTVNTFWLTVSEARSRNALHVQIRHDGSQPHNETAANISTIKIRTALLGGTFIQTKELNTITLTIPYHATDG